MADQQKEPKIIILSGARFFKDRSRSPMTHEDKDEKVAEEMELVGRGSSLYHHDNVLGGRTPAKVDASSMTFSVDEINGQLKSFEQIPFLTNTKIVCGHNEMQSPNLSRNGFHPRQRYQVLKVTDYDLAQPGWNQVNRKKLAESMQAFRPKQQYPLPVRIVKERQSPRKEPKPWADREKTKSPAPSKLLAPSKHQLDYDINEYGRMYLDGLGADSNEASQRSTSQLRNKSYRSRFLNDSDGMARSHVQLSLPQFSHGAAGHQHQQSAESIYHSFGQNMLQPTGPGAALLQQSAKPLPERRQRSQKKHFEVKVVKHSPNRKSPLNVDIAHTSGLSTPPDGFTSNMVPDAGPSPSPSPHQLMHVSSPQESTPRVSKKELDVKNSMKLVHQIPMQAERRFERLGKTKLSVQKEEKQTQYEASSAGNLLPDDAASPLEHSPLSKIDMMQFVDQQLDSSRKPTPARQPPKQPSDEELEQKCSITASQGDGKQRAQRDRQHAVTVVFKKGQVAESMGQHRGSFGNSSAGDLLSHVRQIDPNESTNKRLLEYSMSPQKESTIGNNVDPRKSTNRSAVMSKINLSALTDIYQIDKGMVKERHLDSWRLPWAGRNFKKNRQPMLKAGITGTATNNANLEITSMKDLRRSAAATRSDGVEQQARSLGSKEVNKDDHAGNDQLIRENCPPMPQNQTQYTKARPRLIEAEQQQNMSVVNCSLENAQNAESLESSEFYPNQEVLMPSKPVFGKDQVSFQITNNQEMVPREALEGCEQVAVRLDADLQIQNSSKDQPERGLSELESLENRIKRDLLKTSEGMKTIYQYDGDERPREPVPGGLAIDEPQGEGGQLAKIDSAVFESSQNPSQKHGQYEPLITAGKIPNPITPYMRSFTNNNDAKERSKHPSDNTLLRAGTQSQQDLNRDCYSNSQIKPEHSKQALPQVGFSISTKDSKQYINQQQNQRSLNFNFGVEAKDPARNMPNASSRERLGQHYSSAKQQLGGYVSPRIAEIGFEQNVDHSSSPEACLHANGTPGTRTRQVANSNSSFEIAHIKIRQPPQGSLNCKIAEDASRILSHKRASRSQTRPTAKERASRDISAREFRIEEPESGQIKTVEMSPGIASPGPREPTSSPFAPGGDEQKKPALLAAAPRRRVDEIGGAALDSFSRSNRSNVVVFSKVPTRGLGEQFVESQDYHAGQQTSQGQSPSYNSVLGKSPFSLPLTLSGSKDAPTESFLQTELVSAFDKIKVTREQIQELRRLARMRKQQNQQNSVTDVSRIKQYSQMYLKALQQSDYHSSVALPDGLRRDLTRATSDLHMASKTGTALQAEAEELHQNLDLFTDMLAGSRKLLPSQRYQSGCRQSIFIPSGLPQVSSMASIRNRNTKHNAFHTPSKLKKSSCDKLSPSRAVARPRNQIKRNVASLPSVRVQEFDGIASSNEAATKNGTPVLTQAGSPTRDEQAKAGPLEQMPERSCSESNQPSGPRLVAQQPPDEVLKLPKIIKIHQNLDNSVSISRQKSIAEIVQATQPHHRHDRFKLLQQRATDRPFKAARTEEHAEDQMNMRQPQAHPQIHRSRIEGNLRSQIHLSWRPSLHDDEGQTWEQSLRAHQEELQKQSLNDIRKNASSALTTIEYQRALEEVNALKSQFMISLKMKSARNRIAHSSLTSQSVMKTKRNNLPNIPYQGSTAQPSPSQRAKQVLRQNKERRRRVQANLSVQSMSYNPSRTHIEDIMQERLAGSLRDLANGVGTIKRDRGNSPMLPETESFERLFPGITQQKLDYGLLAPQGEEYYRAINDHTERMQQFIDTSIIEKARKLSQPDIESILMSSATMGKVLTQPASNIVTPRQLQRQAELDEDHVPATQLQDQSNQQGREQEAPEPPPVRELNPGAETAAGLQPLAPEQRQAEGPVQQAKKANLDADTPSQPTFSYNLQNQQKRNKDSHDAVAELQKPEKQEEQQSAVHSGEKADQKLLSRSPKTGSHLKVIRWAERDKLRAIRKLKAQSDKFKIQNSVIAIQKH